MASPGLQLHVSEAIFEAFSGLHLGVLVLRDVVNSTEDTFVRDLERAQDRAKEAIGATPVTEHPRIHCWRDAYRQFGAKPKKYPSSIENLVRRSLKGERLRSINPLVDIYNIVSLEHLIPVGGEDLDAVVGDIRLRRAGVDEPAVALLGEDLPRPPKEGEVIYADDVGAICRRWNWKEAARTKLTPETQNAVLVLEALPPVGRSDLEAAMEDLAQRLTRVVGGDVHQSLVQAEASSVQLLSRG